MKKLIILAIALFTLNVSATENPVKPNEALRSEIVDLIGPNSPESYKDMEVRVEVIFTVNSKSEIIVLHANTANKLAEDYIKNKLNYKKVDFTSTGPGELYLLPVTFKKS